MKRIITLLAALMLLASCNSSPSPEASPSGVQPEPNLSPSSSPASSAPSGEPSAQPNASESIPPDEEDDPLTAAYKNGELVIDPEGTALNYQPWLNFTLALEKGEDTRLTVYLAGIAEKSAGGAVWRGPSGSGADAPEGSEFTVAYDASSGKHTLSLDGQEVLSFTYYPTSPREVARFWGYAPLEELAPFYTWHEALADGCFVITDTAENMGMLTAFSETFGFDDGSFLRVCEVTIEGDVILTDIAYNGERACITRDATRDKFGGGSEIFTLVFDDCELALLDAGNVMELRLHDNQTGLDHMLLKTAR